MPKKLFLLDGMALTYRAYFSMIRTPLVNSKGMNTSAIYGFVNTLNRLLEIEKPDYIAVAFDTAEPTFRHKIYPEYKATRQAMPDDLVPQIDHIKEVISAFNIPMIELSGYEADDIIGTLVKRAELENTWSYMVTPDKDYMQLIDRHIWMYKPSRSLKAGTGGSGAEVEIIGVDGVKERFGVLPEQVTDVLALMGDSVDNIPGVKGVGEKTAIMLIQEFGSLDNLYNNLHKINKPKLRENLFASKKDAYKSKELVTIHTDVPIKIDYHTLKATEKNTTLLEKLYTEFEFRTLLKKLSTVSQPITIKAVAIEEKKQEEDIAEQSMDDINTFKHKYYTIYTNEEFKRLTERLSEEEEFSFDTETTSDDPMKAELVGLSFAYNEGEAFYVPLKFPDTKDTDLFGNPSKAAKAEKLPALTLDFVLEHLKPLLEKSSIRKIGQNIKFDMLVMKNYGINLENVGFDTMIAAYILKPESNYKMDYLSEVYLKYRCIPITELLGENKAEMITMDKVPYKKVTEYAAEDADVTLRLYHRLEYELKKISLDKLCNEIEFPLIEVLADMEFTGVGVDKEFINNMNIELKEIEQKLESDIHKLAGEKFNINSPKQLSDILFEKLKLTKIKKLKTVFSTDTSVLEELRHEHPIANKLLDYRTVNKLRTTYTEGLLGMINPKTGKVHTSFNQTVAATGRLSSANPNLQNIPIRTEIGKKLRKAFIPSEKGDLILSADYSQIELRIMAHLANDENMIKAFERKHDIHTDTASKIFKVKADKVDSNMRRKAKEVNFGIIYGIQAYGLSNRLDIDQNEARELITSYFTSYPNVQVWLDKTKKFAREHGYTETLTGRRRYLPNINNKNSVVRQRDERIAINMPVQGTAADMIKIAMINIYKEFKKEKIRSKMILQVHDELIFEVKKDELEEVEKIVANKMKHALKLNVPIVVDIGIGESWFDTHK